MFYVISYDIPDDKRRLKISKTLKNFGERVQYSVFEANLTEPQFQKLLFRLEKLLNEKEDRLRIYTICDACMKKVQVKGLGKLTEDEDVYVV